MLFGFISTIDKEQIWIDLKKIKRCLRSEKPMHQLLISIELVGCEQRIRCLKLLQKRLNRGKIYKVLPTKFCSLIEKIEDSKKLSRVEIIEKSQSYDRRNLCSKIIWNNYNIGLWNFSICGKSVRCNRKMIIVWALH